jgi:CRISPR-associated protein Csd1
MILQALYEYYQRKAADPDRKIAPQGFEWKEIPFVVVITKDGKFTRLEDTREGEGKKRKAKKILVPQTEKRTVGIKANLLWDNAEYALGLGGRTGVKDRHEAFVTRIRSDENLEKRANIKSLLVFLADAPIKQIKDKASDSIAWKELGETNANLTFRVEGSSALSICDEIPKGGEATGSSGGDKAICLVSGQKAEIERLHPSIKGVRDAQSSGAALVSFNLGAFKSFGKDQNFNAPVSKEATFAYTTALNDLLSRESQNKMQVGDATTVFWSEQRTELESLLPSFFVYAPKDNPDQDIQAVKNLYKSVEAGAFSSSSETTFYVLGLSPNAARISVRFWHRGTVSELAHKIKAHFSDLEVERPPYEQRFALFYLLCDIAQQGEAKNIPPNLAGNVMRAILEDLPYPAQILQQTIRRIRATQTVTSYRAAWLKAYLNRKRRFKRSSFEEITVSLDKGNISPGYRLGRLFAALEKIQEDAQPGINTTIRDRFYGAASTSPVAVFSQLLKLKNHHLAKLENPAFRVVHEKRLAEIFDPIKTFPAHLDLDQQAQFAIGYYHQRQDFFKKMSDGVSTSLEA